MVIVHITETLQERALLAWDVDGYGLHDLRYYHQKSSCLDLKISQLDGL